MRIVRDRLAVAMALSLALSCITGCGKPEGPPEESGMVLRLASASHIKGFDPVHAGDSPSIAVMALAYEPLLQYKYLERPYAVEPCLAAGMPEVRADGLVYRFRIRRGIRFVDDPCFAASGGAGRELVAEDFIYAFKRLADVKTQPTGWWIFDGKIVGLDAFYKASATENGVDYDRPVEGLRAPDPYTLEIELTGPYPQLLYVLAMTYTSAVAREAVEHYGEEFLNHPVGTGPYRLERWARGSKVVLVRNPGWRGETYPAMGEEDDRELGLLDDAGKAVPFIDRIERTILVESQPRWLQFMKGQFDAGGIPKDNYDSAIGPDRELLPEMEGKGIKLLKTPTLVVTYAAFNLDDPVLGAHKLLRQAMAHAYDIERRIEIFANGRAIPAHGPLPPGLFGYDADYRNPYRDYDVAKAKALLAEAGFPDGGGLPAFAYDYVASTTARQQAELFKREMAEIGIEIELNASTWPQFLERVKGRKAQIWGLAWGADYPDPENFLQLLYGPNSSPGPNGSNFDHPEYNELYDRMRIMPNGDERLRLIRRMVDIVSEECPWILGTHPFAYTLQQAWLKNYKPHEVGHGLARYYRIDSDLRNKLLAEKF